MQEPDVTRHPGVYDRRPQSTFWWFYQTVPTELAHRFRNPWAVRESLKTRDLKEANALAKIKAGQWEQTFAAMRLQDNPQTVKMSPALAASVAAEVRRWVLQADDNARDFPGFPEALIRREERLRLLELLRALEASPLAGFLPFKDSSPLTIKNASASKAAPAAAAPTPDPLAGLSEAHREALARFNIQADDEAAVNMQARNLRAVLPLADAALKEQGLATDWLSPEGRAGLLTVLKAYRQGRADVVRRDAGEAVDTPLHIAQHQQHQEDVHEATGGPAATQQGHTPRDAFNAWEKLKPGRPAKSLMVYRNAADKLVELLQGRPLEAMTREDGRTFVAQLLREAEARGPRGRNTAVNILSRWKTLMAQAVDLDWIPRSPLQGRTIESTATSRGEWSLAELVLLFDDPLFTSYSIPEASMAGADTAYWLPLLGLFTGARISELAQLGINDVQQTEDAGWVVAIHEEGENQRVKTASAVRSVPVHPELVRLGFLDYWQAIKELGATRLWPAVVFTELNGAGGEVSKWFGKYKSSKGFGPDRVFHSFRHTLQTRLLALGVPESHADTLAGRAGKSVGRKSYTHLKPADVRPSLERLQFPELNLPRVFAAPVWTPAASQPCSLI